MNVQNILKQYPYIHEEITNLQRELNDYLFMREQRQNILKAPALSDMPHSTDVSNPTLEAIEDIIDKFDVMIQRYIRRMDELMTLKEELDQALHELEADEKRVIEQRYFYFQGMGKIAYGLRRSRKHVYSIHDKAVVKLAEKMA